MCQSFNSVKFCIPLHYPGLALHPGATRLYYSVIRFFSGPYVAHYVYTFVGQCESCVKNRGGLRKHKKYLKIFPAADLSAFGAIEMLGSLPQTRKN